MKNLEQASVGDQETPDTGVNRALDVLDGVAQLMESPQATRELGSVGASNRAADAKLLSRSHEEADLNALVGTDARHLCEFARREQHGSAALARAVDRHLSLTGLVDDGAQRLRTLDARYLDPEVCTVGEARGTRRGLISQFTDVPRQRCRTAWTTRTIDHVDPLSRTTPRPSPDCGEPQWSFQP